MKEPRSERGSGPNGAGPREPWQGSEQERDVVLMAAVWRRAGGGARVEIDIRGREGLAPGGEECVDRG